MELLFAGKGILFRNVIVGLSGAFSPADDLNLHAADIPC